MRDCTGLSVVVHNRGVTLERIWNLETRLHRAISAALLPVSWLYSLGWLCYASIYRLGLKSQKRFDGLKVVCVGNLEVGGVGKTPAVIEIARLLVSRGVNLVISMSAYGSPSSAGASLAPTGSLDPKEYGDEPTVVRRRLPTVPIILGRNRVAAASIAASSGFDMMLMDDGFQHLPLARDCDILVWDSARINSRCMPAGPLREPVSGMSRAHALLSVRCDAADEKPPCFAMRRVHPQFESLDGTVQYQIDALRDETVDVLCAIGKPEQFVSAVSLVTARVANKYLLPDHADLKNLPSELLGTTGRLCVVTEKDAVKLMANGEHQDRFRVLILQSEICDAEGFANWLAKSISL